MRNIGVIFDVDLNNLLNKQSIWWWFEGLERWRDGEYYSFVHYKILFYAIYLTQLDDTRTRFTWDRKKNSVGLLGILTPWYFVVLEH